MDEIIQWPLEGEPWVEYRTRVDLLGQSENKPEVIRARKEMIEHPKIGSLLVELKKWLGKVLSSHRSASQPFHKLSFITDLGLKKCDSPIDEIIEKIFEHQSDEGSFQLPMKISKSYGGSGVEEWAWALCDAPLIVYSLAKFGLSRDERIQKAVNYLVGPVRKNGWPCAVSKELGNFRGPGKKSDPFLLRLLRCLRCYLNLMNERITKRFMLEQSAYCICGREAEKFILTFSIWERIFGKSKHHTYGMIFCMF